MKDLKKISAFTVLELMVVFALTGIIITGMYYGLSFVNRMNTEVRSSKDKIQQQMTFHSLLKRDVYLADYILGNTSSIELHSSSNIIYEFNNNIVIRKSTRNDTFILDQIVVEIVEIEIQYPEDKKIIKRIDIELEDGQNIIINKSYPLNFFVEP